MNGIINESWLWYCDINDKTISFSSTMRQFKSKSQKHKKKMVLVLKILNSLDEKMMK